MRSSIFKSKRGISPLIATVLLIAFAVALGAVVMNWGKQYVEEQAADAKMSGQAKQLCTSTELIFETVSRMPQICYRGNTTNTTGLDFTIRNIASHDILDMQLTVLGTDDVLEVNLKDDADLTSKFALGPNKILRARDFNITGIGGFTKAIFTPGIKVDGKKDPQLCSDNVLDVEITEIEECN